MGDVKLDTSRETTGGNLIIYEAFHQCNPGVFARNEIGNLRLVPNFPVISPTIEVEADEEDTVEPEHEAYDNGLDPELDYPIDEIECASTEDAEDDGVCPVQADVLLVEVHTPSQMEIEFIKVETT